MVDKTAGVLPGPATEGFPVTGLVDEAWHDMFLPIKDTQYHLREAITAQNF